MSPRGSIDSLLYFLLKSYRRVTKGGGVSFFRTEDICRDQIETREINFLRQLRVWVSSLLDLIMNVSPRQEVSINGGWAGRPHRAGACLRLLVLHSDPLKLRDLYHHRLFFIGL